MNTTPQTPVRTLKSETYGRLEVLEERTLKSGAAFVVTRDWQGAKVWVTKPRKSS